MIRERRAIADRGHDGGVFEHFSFEHEEGSAGAATKMAGLGSDVKRVGNVMECKLESPHSCCLRRWGT